MYYFCEVNTPKIRQAWIVDELKISPNITYLEMFTKYSCAFTNLSLRTFAKDWKAATEEHKTYLAKVHKVKEKISICEDVKAFKEGLRGKTERLFTLQNLVDDCLKDLTEGKTDDEYFKNGKPVPYRRKMTNTEYNQTRRTLKDLQAEISKIEGDYAPAKSEVTGEIKTSFANTKQEKDFNDFLKKKYNLKDK